MKYIYKSGMHAHTHTLISIVLKCALSHTTLHVEFPIVLLNMYGECAGRATGGGAFLMAFSVLCLISAAVRYSFISPQVGQDKVHKDGGL